MTGAAEVRWQDGSDVWAYQPFGGYPYIATRIGRTPLRHIALVPRDWHRDRMLDLTRRQASANRLPTALCLGPHEVIYVDESLEERSSEWIPVGLPVIDRLKLAVDMPTSDELDARRAWLRAWARHRSGSGYLVGDGLEAGRPATAAERRDLGGVDRARLPRGLAPCDRCGELRGEYLAVRGEGNGDETPRVIEVHCRCANWNRCAGCGGLLAEHRLSAYHWNREANAVRYLAAYGGLGHACRSGRSGGDR